MKEIREVAARALCRKAGNVEMARFEGKPLWMSYLVEVDTVLAAIGYDSIVAKERERCANIVENWHKDHMNQPLTFVGGKMKLTAAHEIAEAIRKG